MNIRVLMNWCNTYSKYFNKKKISITDPIRSTYTVCARLECPTRGKTEKLFKIDIFRKMHSS